MIYLFMIYESYLKIYTRNSEIAILDLIYKINIFNILLLNFVRLIIINMNFFIASIFLSSEIVSDFK